MSYCTLLDQTMKWRECALLLQKIQWCTFFVNYLPNGPLQTNPVRNSTWWNKELVWDTAPVLTCPDWWEACCWPSNSVKWEKTTVLPLILLLSCFLHPGNSTEVAVSVTAAVRRPDDQSLCIISPPLRGVTSTCLGLTPHHSVIITN